MAIYAQDFEGYSTGTGVPSGWTQRWVTTGVTTSVLDVSSDRTLRRAQTTNARRGITYNTVDSDADRDDCEVLALVSVDTIPSPTVGSTNCGPALRGSGAAGSENVYTARLYTPNGTDKYLQVHKYVGGTGTTIVDYSFSWSTGTKYWIRLRANGTTVQAKIWADGGSEPGTWQVDTTDSSISGTGWAGIFTFQGAVAANHDTYAIAIATNGDTASFSSAVTGTGALTTGTTTASGTGVLSHTGTGAVTTGNTTASGTGVLGHTGTGAPTIGNATASGAGVLGHTGTGALSTGNTTADGTGTVTSAGTITGTGALTTSSVTASGSGVIAHTGTGAILISDIVVSGAGVLSHNGTGAVTVGNTTASGAGGVVGTVTGTGGLTANTVTLSGTGSVTGLTTLTAADLEAIWDVELETGYTARQMMRIMFAALAGKRSGLGTSTESYYDVATGTTVRISLTPDQNGNGTPVVDGT